MIILPRPTVIVSSGRPRNLDCHKNVHRKKSANIDKRAARKSKNKISAR
jgi:hypothetical protein